MRGKSFLPIVSGFLALVLCLSLVVTTVQAEEAAGYHEKTVAEDEATDTWYAIARGTYLSYGTSKVKAEGSGKVTISGSTEARSICDEVLLSLYLDESSNGSSYGTIGTYHFSSKKDVSVSGGKSNVQGTVGWYYSARGVHTVYQGSVKETTDTVTDAIKAK